MKSTFAGWLGLCFVLGCAAPEPEPGAAEAAFKGVPDFVAGSAEGGLALASGASGAVRARVPVEGTIEDIAWDPWKSRALVVVGQEDDEGGEIAAYAVRTGGGARLGTKAHLAWLDGRARLLASPFGVIVFEESYGERWKLLGSAPTPSAIAPPPSSAWLTVRASGATVHAFGEGQRREAEVTSAGISTPIVQPLADVAGARLVPAPALGGEALVAVEGGALTVRVVRDGEVLPASSAPLGAMPASLEGVVALERGAIVVALLSGKNAIVALALDDGGDVESVAELSLPGDVAENGRLLSRDLAVLGTGRVLAATSAGVLAVNVTRSATGIQIGVVPGFEGMSLRRPIAVISSSP